MSSRNKKHFLQLSIATLFLFQFFLMFSPSAASGLLNNVRFAADAKSKIRYEFVITSVDNKVLPDPILVSTSWNDLGIEDYASAQLLIDDLARALDRGDMAKAHAIYNTLADDHFDNLDGLQFEIQQLQITRAPVKLSSANLQKKVLANWSSDLLATQ